MSQQIFNLHPTTIFVLKMLSAFYVRAHIQVHFRLDFFHGLEASNMNPDQTAPKGAV